MRLVHFSDIHLAALTRDPSALFDKRIFGLINFVLRRSFHQDEAVLLRAVERIPALRPDCVVCTGDVTCVGSPEEFERAVQKLTPLVQNDAFDFIYVPGNHDVYVRNSRCRDSLRWAFAYLNRNRWPLTGLPRLHRMGSVELFLMNHCLPTSIVLSTGCLDEDTRAAFQAWVSRPRTAGGLRVAVGHFPTRKADGEDLGKRRRLEGVEVIRNALSDGGIDVALCGHIHSPYLLRDPDSRGLEVCAGSLTMGGGRLNILDIDQATGECTQSWEQLTPA